MRQTTRRIALLFCFAASLAVLSHLAQAQTHTITVLHNFSGPDGNYPLGGLTLDRAGNLYGTTNWGGASNMGTVFRLSRAGSGWVLTTLHTFQGAPNDGAYPYSGVVFGPDGALYGTTYRGGTNTYNDGNGTVYRLQPPATVCHAVSCPWEETVIHSFGSGDDGEFPQYGNLVFDRAGNIYGTTLLGGFSQQGTLFELSPSGGSWTESVLYDFVTQSGSQPYSGVIFDSAGNLYGTASAFGPANSGVIYKLSPSGSGFTQTVLSSNELRLSTLYAGMVMDGQGNL